MAFPNITPLRTTQSPQRPNSEVLFVSDGNPYVIEFTTDTKHEFTAEYLLSSAQWALLIADFEINHSTAFSWNDERDNPSTSRAVRYAGRPQRTRVAPDGVTAPGTFFVTVPLVEV